MTQEVRWQKRYDEVVTFIENNKRNPSKFELSERQLYTWMKHNRKQMNAGVLKPEWVVAFKELLLVCEGYRRKNQYE